VVSFFGIRPRLDISLFNTLVIRDLGKSMPINWNQLKRIADDDINCIHVGFALALPEVRMALKSILTVLEA
jgi:hypothetical protein